MKPSNRLIHGYLLLVFGLAGCAPSFMTVEREFINYTDEPLTSSSILPSVSVDDDKPKTAAVAEFSLPNENQSPDYKMARLVNLTQYASEIVNDKITKAGGALVDKQGAEKIKKYIQLNEKHGGSTGNLTRADKSACHKSNNRKKGKCRVARSEVSGIYKGLSEVNYAVLGEISSVSYGYSNTNYSSKNGTMYYCNYSATVSGTLAVYRIPNTTRAESIRFEGSDSSSNQGTCEPGSLNPGVIKTAMDKAISSVQSKLQSLFVTDAYILQKKVDSKAKKEIFEISYGSNMKLQPGIKVRIIHLENQTDALNGESIIQETMVGEGYISDKIGPKRAWILVDPENDKGIRKWDVCRPKHEDCNTPWCQNKLYHSIVPESLI